MTAYYYKRYFHEPQTEKFECWGACSYYFETTKDGEILRQIEDYDNGEVLKYDGQFIENDSEFIVDQRLILNKFENFSITKSELETQWIM